MPPAPAEMAEICQTCCAVAPATREAGRYLFYGKEPEPPPYPLSEARAAEFFGKYFRLIRDVRVSDSVAMFAGMERWQEWQLRSGATDKG